MSKNSNRLEKIYFITNGFNIKIGFTSEDVQKRLKQLNTGSDIQLYLLGYMTGTLEDEHTLHQLFEKIKLRSNGEWFKGTDQLISYINEVNEIKNVWIIKNEYLRNYIMQTVKTNNSDNN